MEEAPTLFDHVVVNEDLDQAIEDIVGLITAG
jgi:guanylate kinase